MPANISASRMAAVLTDFEFSHALMELYFRRHGLDLGPMHDDKTLWAIMGPLTLDEFRAGHDRTDREGTDAVVTTAAGTQMTLPEFYEMKRRYMHRALADMDEITPRDIDEVYTSLCRILRDAYVEAGGVLGKHSPDAVLAVVNEVHEALRQRYLG
jgi:hypothetical protein